MTVTTSMPLSALIRERSKDAHSSSEGAGFVSSLLRGERSRDDYIALVAQHYFIYAALEAGAERMRNDPIAARFITDRLTRLPALETDLEFLLGTEWRDRIDPLDATARYVKRIERVAETWAGGFVAHHYTRYLGDLSGGLHIGKVIKRQFGFDTNGIDFYMFGDITNPAEFKNRYRNQLDDTPWDEEERERVIAEVLRAYQFNSEVFEQLAEERAIATPTVA
ncbi:MAG: heme oxygenase (biliverdin-producing) [Cellulomonadaceae bacterium]